MTDLMNLDFRGNAVRMVMREGEPWWVVNDICAVLDIKNTRDVLTRLPAEDVAQTDALLSEFGGAQRANVVNESGLYELIFRSEKPAAKDFRRWVTRDVLPEIRRTGMYVGVPISPELQRVMALVQAQVRQEAELHRLRLETAKTTQQIVGVSARVESVEERVLDLETISPLADAGQLLTLRDLAHACETGQNRMKKWLMEQGIMFRDHQNNDRVKQHPWVEDKLALDRWEESSNGYGWFWVPYFTPRGVARIKQMREAK